MNEGALMTTKTQEPTIENKCLSDGPDWTFELLDTYLKEVDRVAKHYRLDTYPHQIEIITSEQMMDAYSSIGMPINYTHWSFGKKFIETERLYKHGQQGLAYEIVINSNPCIAYLMEENTITMQALVMAHACYGHNSFFKNNYLFRSWTDASSIIDYLLFVNTLWKTLPRKDKEEIPEQVRRFPSEPQENILYFMEKNAPLLEPWQREVVRIVRKVSQYFYPQKQTQVMNEGWATFWHYTILNHLYDEGKVSDRFMLEFLHSHTNVVSQPAYNSPYYSGINPYALGFAMFQDIKRICQSPTDEDRYWFPDIAGKDWLDTLHFAMRDFKDESFISQFLSPKIIRDFRLFTILDDDRNNFLEVSSIHNETGYRAIRQALSAQYNLSNHEPNIQIWNVALRGDRSLTLRYIPQDRAPLDNKSSREVMKHLHRLWGFDVYMEQLNEDGSVDTLERCPPRPV
jgi:stage V sporulation protein R